MSLSVDSSQIPAFIASLQYNFQQNAADAFQVVECLKRNFWSVTYQFNTYRNVFLEGGISGLSIVWSAFLHL